MMLVRVDRLNVQTHERIVWPAEPVVAWALLDQLAREDADHAEKLRAEIEHALALEGNERSAALTRIADGISGQTGAAGDVAKRRGLLAGTLREMAGG